MRNGRLLHFSRPQIDKLKENERGQWPLLLPLGRRDRMASLKFIAEGDQLFARYAVIDGRPHRFTVTSGLASAEAENGHNECQASYS